MSTIYAPAGRAGEYGELAVNLFRGCTHGCSYCYVPGATRTSRDKFNGNVVQGSNVIKNIAKDAPKYKGQEVFFCFTCDPYPVNDPGALARQAIEILHANGVKVRILTKAGTRATRDFDLLAKHPELSAYGVTLTFDNEVDSLEWEPGAASPSERIESLKLAHKLGIPTWVSMEPVIVPKQTLKLISKTHKFVDLYKIGKWNHDARAKDIDWGKFGHEAIALCEKYGKEYYIKTDLKKYL